MAKKPRDPFDVSLTKEQREKLALWLSQELDNGLNAKSAQDIDVDYWHMLYEQARTRSSKNLPWPDAADLTSHLACANVDALHARAMKTIWTEPVCTVEGWGQAADNAPFVEEFHQWKAEEERLQSVQDGTGYGRTPTRPPRASPAGAPTPRCPSARCVECPAPA